jgi:hypothetical protein
MGSGKRCTKCRKTKPLTEFYQRPSRSSSPDKAGAVLYRSDCKSCHRAVMKKNSRAHYRDNTDYYRKRNRKRAREIMAFIRQFKEDRPTCADCGLDHPWWRLDFDHLDGSEKTACISQSGSRGWSIERVLEEMEKCEVVCANCHRDRTHARNGVD